MTGFPVWPEQGPEEGDDFDVSFQALGDWTTPRPEYKRAQRCTHNQTEVELPSGVVVYVHSVWGQRHIIPDYALYLDPAQFPKAVSLSMYIPWEDKGLPLIDYTTALDVITATYEMAKADAIVELGCYAGHGRAATVLGCMVKLDTDDCDDPLRAVSELYCAKAVEDMTVSQAHFVDRFEP